MQKTDFAVDELKTVLHAGTANAFVWLLEVNCFFLEAHIVIIYVSSLSCLSSFCNLDATFSLSASY